MKELAKKLIKLHEGLKLKPYECPSGYITIGYGRNIQQNGITLAEAEMLLDNDIERVITELEKWLSVFNELSENRKAALIDMSYNLGFNKLFQFRNFLAALQKKDFDLAAKEMLDSKWAAQVGNRATVLANMMKEG
jgi:lysozyme